MPMWRSDEEMPALSAGLKRVPVRDWYQQPGRGTSATPCEGRDRSVEVMNGRPYKDFSRSRCQSVFSFRATQAASARSAEEMRLPSHPPAVFNGQYIGLKHDAGTVDGIQLSPPVRGLPLSGNPSSLNCWYH